MIRRREFITLLGGAVAWPVAARAQRPSRPSRLGVLGPMLNNPTAIAQRGAIYRGGMVDPINLIDGLFALAAIGVSRLLLGVAWYEASRFKDFWW